MQHLGVSGTIECGMWVVFLAHNGGLRSSRCSLDETLRTYRFAFFVIQMISLHLMK